MVFVALNKVFKNVCGVVDVVVVVVVEKRFKISSFIENSI